MINYQKRSDYKGIKKEADKFYKELKDLKTKYRTNKDEKVLDKIVALYDKMKETRLYKERGGLYCQILQDANK